MLDPSPVTKYIVLDSYSRHITQGTTHNRTERRGRW